MKRKPRYDKTLAVLLMALSLLPLLQGWFRLVALKPLHGVTIEAEKPVFDMGSYRSGAYAKDMEAYASQRFGFREPVIRLYNQYLWTFYRKTYAHDVAIGKKDWLYYPQSVSDYYGNELLRWHPSVDEARRSFDLDVKHANWVRSVLKESGVDFLVFMAPEKGFLYPEFLPDGEKDTTTFNACDYFAQRFTETGFPHIEMTRWFQQMKDTVDYPLIPQVGAHWIFPSVYAADSLSRLMEDLKGVHLPKIKIGEAYHTRDRDHDYDNDLEKLLNLAFAMRHQYGYCPRRHVGIEQDSSDVKPKVLFVGNSYFWAMNLFVPFDEMFETTEFWYYYSTAYYGDSLQHTAKVNELDQLDKLLGFDYVVWFTTGNQMNKGTSAFVNATLLNLCLSNAQVEETRNRVVDSLIRDSIPSPVDSLTMAQLRLGFWSKAQQILVKHPERYFAELSGDSLPPTARNPRIKEILAINEIRKDSAWMWNLSACQTVIQNAPMEQVLLMEARNMIDGKPLLRDMPDPVAVRDLVEQRVADMIKEIKGKPKLMRRVEEKAAKNGVSVEKQTELDARWIVHGQMPSDGF